MRLLIEKAFPCEKKENMKKGKGEMIVEGYAVKKGEELPTVDET